jgi:hypothetical protein
MSQAGFTPIYLYRSTVASATPNPANLGAGELAINLADKKLYALDDGGNLFLLASAAGTLGTVSSVSGSGGTTGLTLTGGPITTTGTLTLGGTLTGANGGTGVNNGSSTITLAGNLVTSGAYSVTLTSTASTNVTLPTTGTLATLAGSETFTNKTLTSPIISTISNTGTLTLPTSTDTLVGRATADTLTNKSLLPRVVSTSTASSITINADTTDVATMANTQGAATFTVNAPSGTPVNGQKLMFRMSSTAVQTFSWNAIFQGSSDVSLPTVSSSGGKFDYMGFMYNSTAAKWQLIATNFGF